MRPLSRAAAPQFYHELDANHIQRTFDISYLDADQEPQNETLTYQDILDFLSNPNFDWVDIRKNLRTKAFDKDLKAAWRKKNAIVKRLSKYYRNSIHDLIDKFGGYCAYCGTSVQANAHVEHKLPKAVFPQDMLSWSNFLLACRDCNSAKGEKPTGQPGSQKVDFIWPDEDFRTMMIWERLPDCDLETVGVDKYRPANIGAFDRFSDIVTAIWADQLKAEITKPSTREFSYHIPQPPPVAAAGLASNNRKRGRDGDSDVEEVWRTFFAYSSPTLSGGAKTLKTINELFHLNRYTKSSDVSDRRATARAQTWLQAAHALARLKSANAKNLSGPAQAAFYNQVQQTVSASGHWSVWVEVFVWRAQFHLHNDQINELTQFLLGGAFPGTDAARA